MKPVTYNKSTVLTKNKQEQIVLAAMMRDPAVFDTLCSSLNEDMFSASRHKEIFSVFKRLRKNGLGYSTEVFELEAQNYYGGREYLSNILERFPTSGVNLKAHVEQLKLAAIKFRLATGSAQRLLDAANNPYTTLEELQQEASQITHRLEGHGIKKLLTGKELEAKYMADFERRLERKAFVPSGFHEFDEYLTEGFAPQRVSVITARPSIGKSTFAWNMASRMHVNHGVSIIYFALEMSTESVLDGILASNTMIPLDAIIKNPTSIGNDKYSQMQRCLNKFTDGGFAIWDQDLSIEKAAMLIREGNHKVAIWDLWEKIVPEKTPGVISLLLDKTQLLAKSTDCHQCLVHQTRRSVDGRANRRPTLTDLKNSGGYEEVADLVIGLYRESYYSANVNEDVLEIGILKQRRGVRSKWLGYRFEAPFGRVGDFVREIYQTF